MAEKAEKKTAEVYKKGTIGYEIMNGMLDTREFYLRSLSKEADRQKMLKALAQKADQSKDPAEKKSIASTLKRFGFKGKQDEQVNMAKQGKPKRPNPFAGADDIYLTKSKIAVTKTKKSKAKRGYSKTTQTKYYEQNDSNLKLLKKAQGDAVRSGRKGTQIKKI